MKRNLNILFLFFAIVFFSCTKKVTTSTPIVKDTVAFYDWKKFSMGADLSYATQMKDKGVSYKDNGSPNDIFTISKNNGCNTVRLKLWHTPSAYVSTWGGNDQQYNSLQQVEVLIKKAKSLGMAVSLDFHYSDTWADPQRQEIPKAWKNLDLAGLNDSVYQYTLDVLNYLQSKDLVPEMVQVGNENNNGMLWPLGEVKSNNFTAFASLLNSGIKAVREFSKTSAIKPKIIVHEAQLQHAEWWTAGIVNAGVTDFDILGLSHYADWSTINTMPEISALIKKLKTTYNKEIMIVELAYWWNTKDASNYPISQKPVAGYPFTVAGQYQYLKDFTQTVITAGATGIHYWAPDYISSGGEMTARTLVDMSGNTIQGIKFMKFAYQF